MWEYHRADRVGARDMPARWACPRGVGYACLGLLLLVGGTIRQVARRVSGWARDYLRRAALADFGCAILGVFVAAQLRFGNDVTGTYVALSLALPVLWIVAVWLAGGYDVRFIGTGSDEFRKVLNAGVGLTAAIALFSYAVNLELSRGYVLIALPSTTLFDLVTRFTHPQAAAPAARTRPLHAQRGGCGP